MSNICYTILDKFLQDSLWGFPAQRSHRKLVIVSAIIDLELSGKVLKGIKSMRGIKPFVILTVVPFHFPVMPGGGKKTDELIADPVFC